MAVALAILGLLIGALGFALLSALADRRARRNIQQGAAPDRRSEASGGGAQAAAVDHLPEVRRALREDRVLARRVMGELLRENQIEKVAVAVELIGPGVVEDLRGDPACALGAARGGGAAGRRAAPHGHARDRRPAAPAHPQTPDGRRRRSGRAGVRVPARACRRRGWPRCSSPEPPSVRAAALRYAPAHLRSTYLEARSTGERAALAAAIASPKSLSKEHLLDVAATLRARAIEQAHLDSGQTGDIDLAVELVEERPMDEQAEILDAMRRADPAKARAVEAALITEQSFELVSEEVLGAAVVGVPTEILARFLRTASATVATRTMATLPRTVAAALEEDLSLVVALDAARDRGGPPRAVRGVATDAARPRPAGAPDGERQRLGISDGEGQGKDGGTMKTRSLLWILLLASLLRRRPAARSSRPASPDGGMTKIKLVPVPIPIRPDALPQPHAAGGERPLRRQPAALVGEPRRPVRGDHDGAS